MISMNGHIIPFKLVYRYNLPLRIYDPIFSHSAILVIVKLLNIIIRRISRRNNLYNEIWRTITPFTIKLCWITYDHKIRLYELL